ncbi:MAG: RnfABCDGE type electron transport complex subunit D [Actinomycetota bacterium]|nr:RnfABCDGE type electron transport complex subunit D [Actinomycetota bacterium]
MGSDYIVSTPPHIRSGETIEKFMAWTFLALTPLVVAGLYAFGFFAFRTLILSILSAVAMEAAVLRYRKMPIVISDGSAIITGLILALTLPPKVPYWIPIVGGALAIFFGKQLFGGLGYNVFNPALVGRAMLVLSWPSIMSGSWFTTLRELDGITTATPLTAAKAIKAGTLIGDISVVYKPLLFLNRGGCMGEVSALLLIIGGLVLIARRVVDWRIPLFYLGTVFVMSILTGNNGVFNILAGALIFGAFFLASDPVTSPVTRRAKMIYGICLGLVTILIRFYTSYSEGVMFAILFMNSFAALIDRYTRPITFGTVKAK